MADLYPIDVVITSLEMIHCYELNTGVFMFAVDELQNATLAQTQDTQDITGKQGRKLSKIKRNKGVTVSGDSGMVSGGLLAMQTGGKFTEGNTTVKWYEYLTVDKDGKAKTEYKAVGTSGAEIQSIDMKDANGIVVEKLEQAATAAKGKFAYAPATKELTFDKTSVPAGTEIVVTYDRTIEARSLENFSDVYSSQCEMFIDAMGEDKCGNVYHIQFHIPKADFNGEFSFEMGDNQTVQSFEAEALAGACGSNGKLFDFTVFGVDAADVTA